MALISVNLGIMNLFPLPVLDGGHLVFLTMEAVKGKPVSERVQSICYRIGAALLLSLTVFALFNGFSTFQLFIARIQSMKTTSNRKFIIRYDNDCVCRTFCGKRYSLCDGVQGDLEQQIGSKFTCSC